MVAFLYRWRIKAGMERQFGEAWAVVTRHHLANSDSRGSRLHKGSDGLFYGYAVWPDAETREIAFERPFDLPETQLMRDAIEEPFPAVQLEILDDLITS